MKNIAIFIFEDVEVLDFAGPFEVFSVAAEKLDPPAFRVYTVARTADAVRARGGLMVVPHFTLDSMPRPDFLLIPGGRGTRPLVDDAPTIDWIRAQYDSVERLLSVCTGSLLLAKAGLLNGLDSTTHHSALKSLRELAPDTRVRDDLRYVDNGRIVTSAGVSAGIDMALHIVEQELGTEIMQPVMRTMEYSPAI